MDQLQCAQCGKEISSGTLSGDFCSECASKLRSELALSFQLRQIWNQISERAARLPVVTFSLVAINVVVFHFVSTDTPSQWGQFLGAVIEMSGKSVIQGQFWRLLTYAFLHFSLLHLISNVVFLLVLGWIVEGLFGHYRLLLLWIASATTGSIADLLFRQPNAFSYGASGVVYGLIGAILSVCIFWRGSFSKRLRCLGITLLILLVVSGMYGDWYAFRSFNPVHLGGLLAGFLIAPVLPLVTEKPRSMILASAAILLVLSGTIAFAVNRQKVWVELDAIDPGGFYMVNASSIPRLEQIVAGRPDILRAHILLAEAYQNGHRYEDAVRQYRYIVQRQPLSERAWYRMGWAFMELGRYDDAIDAFSRSLKIDSNNSSMKTSLDQITVSMDRVALAKAYEGAGQIEKAVAEYKEILRANPGHFIADKELQRLEHISKFRLQ